MLANVARGLLIALTSSERAQTVAMKKRAKRRAPPKPKTPEKTFLEKTWADMRAQLGEHESPPGSNHCPDTGECGRGDMPWCNVRVSLAYIHAGSDAFSVARYRFQLVSAMLEDAKAGRNGLVIT